METMTLADMIFTDPPIIAQLRRDGNYDRNEDKDDKDNDHSTTKTGWKL